MTIWEEETLKLFTGSPKAKADFDRYFEGSGSHTLVDLTTATPFEVEDFYRLSVSMQFGVFLEFFMWKDEQSRLNDRYSAYHTELLTFVSRRVALSVKGLKEIQRKGIEKVLNRLENQEVW
jgi:hypothetical protein